MAEVQENPCGRRSGSAVFGDFPGPDTWDTYTERAKEYFKRREERSQEEKDREKEAIETGRLVPNEDLYSWKWDKLDPRLCSFCGSINPDDAIKLIEQGWEVETTGKYYKRYIQPPGYHKHINDWIIWVRKSQLGEATEEEHPKFWRPTPPTKLYSHHMNEEQVKRFNDLLRNNAD